jgi:transcriptional regulator with XRE-family HTH domain
MRATDTSATKQSFNVKKPNLKDEDIGRRIRARRLGIGMSQSDLGKKLGLTFQQVQKYEKGVNRVGSGRLQEIARILGVSTSSFFEEEEDTQAITDFIDTAQAARLIRAYSRIKDPKLRRALVNMAVQIAENEA